MSRQLLYLTIMALFLLQSDALAGSGAEFKHMDRNRDGFIDRQEWRLQKDWQRRQRVKVNTWWESRADVNNDGVVDPEELSSWKRLQKEKIDLDNDGEISAREKRICWKHVRSRVDSLLESEFDKNNDGWLQPEEAKEYLKSRYALIKTKGEAKADSFIEQEYDIDKDGIIEREEAEIMKQDLQM